MRDRVRVNGSNCGTVLRSQPSRETFICRFPPIKSCLHLVQPCHPNTSACRIRSEITMLLTRKFIFFCTFRDFEIALNCSQFKIRILSITRESSARSFFVGHFPGHYGGRISPGWRERATAMQARALSGATLATLKPHSHRMCGDTLAE